ncbi:MAG: flagellar protein FlaG [Syntrophomonadaceae bacterium]|nr:flagellar protein FlaG [Syntrophomonadaceae bacterium]
MKIENARASSLNLQLGQRMVRPAAEPTPDRQLARPGAAEKPGGDGAVRKEQVAGTEEAYRKDELKLAVEALNKALEAFKPTQLRFVTFEDSEQIQVQIIDQESGKIIREIPPEEIIEAMARFREFVGWLLDKKA